MSKYFDGELLSAYEDLNKEFECKNENVKLHQQITDLESKLAESEKNVEFYQERYSNATTSAYGADLIAKNIQSRLEEEIRELKHQLAEKEKELKAKETLNQIFKDNREAKISFAVEQLKKVKEFVKENESWEIEGSDYSIVYADDVLVRIDNQIEELKKEMK